MKLLAAQVKGNPRSVQTKYGDRSVMDVQLMTSGDTVTIWGSSDCKDILNRCNGERVQVAIDSKGKYHVVEHGSTGLSTTPDPITQTDYNAHNGRSAEIADYVARLGKLYSHCYRTAKTELADDSMTTEDYRAVGTSLFIQAVKHFNL